MRPAGGQVISNMSRPPALSCLLHRKRSSREPTRMSSGMGASLADGSPDGRAAQRILSRKRRTFLAEGEGFEPSIRFPVYTLSKRAPSAARPPLRISGSYCRFNNAGKPAFLDSMGIELPSQL